MGTRILSHFVLPFYLLITALSLLYTMSRVEVPFLAPFTRFGYAAMAPFQGFSRTHGALHAEILTSQGIWEPFDLSPYYPLRGDWESVRMHMRWFPYLTGQSFDIDFQRSNYELIAQKLLFEEREKGRDLRAVRLLWQEWPISPDGYDTLKLSPYMTETFITQVDL